MTQRQNFWRNSSHILHLEVDHQKKELCVWFTGDGIPHYLFRHDGYLLASACLKGESLAPLLDWLMEWEGWANTYDRDRFRERLAEAIRLWQVEEVPL